MSEQRYADLPAADIKTILRNTLILMSPAYQRKPIWAIASVVFAVGSAQAKELCQRGGINPDDAAEDVL